jgi:transposase
MKDNELYQQILGLRDPWEVIEVKLDIEKKEVLVGIGYRKGAKWGVEGEQIEKIYDHAPVRKWRHLDSCQFQTVLEARVPRVKLNDGRVQTVPIPWAEKNSRFTELFECLAIKVLQASSSIEAACQLLGIDWDAAQRIMERAVERGIERRELGTLSVVGMDEKSFLRGQSYASLLYDLNRENPRVLEVVMQRDSPAAELLWETLPEETRQSIRAVCLDMSGIYHEVATEMVPQAKIVHDKFHVSKHLNEAVDKVRRRENKTLQAQGDQRLKGARQLFLFSPENLPQKHIEDFERLKNSDLKAARAWAIKESFRAFWQCHSVSKAQEVFKKWYAWAVRCQLQEIKKIAKMLKKHLSGLLNFILFSITNAVAEGFNSKIQSLKSAARGFKNFLNYRTRILFFCGKLDLFPILSYPL